MSFLVAGALAVGVFAVKAGPALKALAITAGKGAADLPGQLAGQSLSERAKAYLDWRPGADSDSLRDQLAGFGLQSAEDQLALCGGFGGGGGGGFGGGGGGGGGGAGGCDRQALRKALDLLIEASDRLARADVQNDDKMWRHSIHVHHLLVFVAYLQASDLGQDPRRGLLFAERFLQRMFKMFYAKWKAARGALFNKDSKKRAVREDYEVHMQVWVQQLFGVVQGSGGLLRVTTHTCSESGMIGDIELHYAVDPSSLVKCARCPGGLICGGTCSNHLCRGYVPPMGQLASTADGGVHGLMAVQVDGKGEFWPRYATLSGGVLTLYEMPGGLMVSQARVPAGQTITTRPPKTARVGRPHCLRVDLPVVDSTGENKYQFDLTTAANHTRWAHALTGRRLPPPAIDIAAGANGGLVFGFAPGHASVPQHQAWGAAAALASEPQPEPEPEMARTFTPGGTPVQWEWQDTASGRWTPFSQSITSQIEAASAAGIRSVDVAAEYPGCFVDPAPHRLAMKHWVKAANGLDVFQVKAPVRRVVEVAFAPPPAFAPGFAAPAPAPAPAAALAVWSWKGDGGCWVPYSPTVSQRLELALARGGASSLPGGQQHLVALDGGVYEVDIVQLKQRRTDNHNRTRDVKREAVVADGAATAAAEREQRQQEAAIAAVSARIAAEQEERRRIERERTQASNSDREAKLRGKITKLTATLSFLRSEGQPIRFVEEEIDAYTQELLALQQPGLPPGWEKKVDARGVPYYVDHSAQQTQWQPPAGWQG
jgi:hypothetical protein